MTEFCITITYTSSSPRPADAARAADAAAAGGGRVTSLTWEGLDTQPAETEAAAAAAEPTADTAAAGPVPCGPADWHWVGLTLPEPDGRRPRTRVAYLTGDDAQGIRRLLERMSGAAHDLADAKRRSVVYVCSRPGKSPLMLVQDIPADSVSLLLTAIEDVER